MSLIPNAQGRSALMVAAVYRNMKAAMALVYANADVSTQDEVGRQEEGYSFIDLCLM
jgi:hypothetical protein